VSAGPQKTQKTQLQAQRRGQGGGGVKMIQALNLSAAQQTKIKAIRADQKAQMMALKNNTSLSKEQKRTRARSIREASQTKIQQVLTPAQKQKLVSLRAEQRAQRKKLAAQRVQKQASAGTAKVK
jgi:Spy/CpxP family protein refolding chaperone